MPYSNFILQEDEYTYSANIQFDIENNKKLGRFIPNETTIDLLRDYFVDISRENSRRHARILYGSYGTGKSHFLTVLSLLLGKRYTQGVAYDTFLRRINNFDVLLANDIDAFVRNSKRKPYLVVPITFDFDDFERSIYFSLRKALDKHNIKVNFKTFYSYALTLLEQWNSAEESAKRLQDACKKNRVTVEDLQKKLLAFDKKAERVFKSVFSSMTFGVDFIYEATNLIDNLDEANTVICKDFSGIIFIFDEFGRYLEDNIKTIKVKSVQDLAEYCDHGNYDTHLILVSHKEIGLYTKDYGKSVVNEWKKVEGRFHATPINDRQDQCLSLISSILGRQQDYWAAFRDKFARELDELYTSAMDFKGFFVTAIGNENPFEGGFPLHPITLFALDKLSKKVAQNERTFFTYLASKEENSLSRFLNRTDDNEFHFVGIDEIYDYFEPNIKAIQSDTSYEWYRRLASALSKGNLNFHDNLPEVKILKSLVVIGVINDGGTLAPDKKTILSIIDEPKDRIEAALEWLSAQKIIKYVGSYNRYEFFNGSIFDVDAMIQEEIVNISDDLVCKTLNESFVDFVLYCNEYNQEYRIKRMFIPVFATVEDLSRKSFFRQLPEYYDGVLAMVLGDVDTEVQEVANVCNEIPRSIAIVNTDYEHIVHEVKKYIGIQCLEAKQDYLREKDPAIENELKYYKSEQLSLTRRIISEWRLLRSKDTFVIDSGVPVTQCSFADLSRLASNIMFDEFQDTLIVNNELINKNMLSGSMSSAKKVAIRALLKKDNPQNYYGLQYLSPEYICVRSVLAKNDLLTIRQVNDEGINTFPDGRFSSDPLKVVLERYINEFKNRPTQISKFYEEMRKPPFGLREGYLSLLLACIVLPYKKNVIINSHDVDQELTAELFDEMIKRPKDYTITITNWNFAQLGLLDSLENMFATHIKPTTLARNRLKGIYEGMFSQYKTASKFARTTDKYVSEVTKKYRKLMEQSHTSYSKFFFDKLRGVCGDYDTTAETVRGILAELNDAHGKLLADLSQDILSVFSQGVSSRINVASLIEILYRDEWCEKSKKSFDYYTNAWLDYSAKIRSTFTEDDIIAEAAKLLTGLEVLYWSDNHRNEFVEKLRDINKRLTSYIPNDELSEHQVKMTLSSPQGDDREIIFDAGELTQISKTMKNKLISSMNNFGQSVSYEDKVQVLLAVLNDLLEHN